MQLTERRQRHRQQQQPWWEQPGYEDVKQEVDSYRSCDDYDIDNDEVEHRRVSVNDFVHLLHLVDYHRQELHAAATRLREWLYRTPKLAQRFHDYTAAGGVSAEDFELFLKNRFCDRHVRQKRHLRLISSNKNIRRVTVRRGSSGDAA